LREKQLRVYGFGVHRIGIGDQRGTPNHPLYYCISCFTISALLLIASLVVRDFGFYFYFGCRVQGVYRIGLGNQRGKPNHPRVRRHLPPGAFSLES